MTAIRSAIPIVVALAVLILPFTGLIPLYWVTLLNYIGIASLVALGLVLLTGVGGMTSFGQAAFVGIGAYTTALLTTSFDISPWISLAISLLTTLVCALFLGAITVRLSGHFLPLGTLAWGIAIFYLFGNLTILGAHDGLRGIPPLRIGSHALIDAREYFVVVCLAVVISVIALLNLLQGRMGRAIRALRRGSAAAEAFGVGLASAKLQVFVLSATLAGLAGWLYAHFQRSVAPGPFGINAGIEYLLMAVVGGAGSIYGAILGSTAVIFLKDQLQNVLPLIIGSAGNYQTVVFGALLVLMLQLAPQGLWPLVFGPLAPVTPPTRSGDAQLASRPAMTKGEPLLEVRQASKRFGGLLAVNDVTFEVRSGEIVGLIGPNGAGKSTTFNLICGASPLTSGDIRLHGNSIAGSTPQQIAALGVARSFQHANLIGDMSVRENVALGAHLRGHAGMLRAIFRRERNEEALLFAEADRQLQRVGLEKEASQYAGNLALGQLRLLEVARALALDPVLLLLDEPAAGLRYGEKRELARLLRQLRSEGVGILLVEHDMDFVMSLADRLVVLDFGTRIAEGLPKDIRCNPNVIEAYLGGVA